MIWVNIKQLLENQYLVISHGYRLFLSLFTWNYIVINKFSILLLGFSSANHFLWKQVVGQLSAKGKHQVSHYLRHEILTGKYWCFQIFPLLPEVITVAVNTEPLKGAGLASADAWKQTLSFAPTGPERAVAAQHMPVSLTLCTTDYMPFLINQVSLCPSVGLLCAEVQA